MNSNKLKTDRHGQPQNLKTTVGYRQLHNLKKTVGHRNYTIYRLLLNTMTSKKSKDYCWSQKLHNIKTTAGY